MKNLKKTLCLVLALVFVLGLCTMGAGAFSDDAQVEYDKAVTVMAGLGIIKGDDNDGDGKFEFRPLDSVTRAEAAKMITYMILGEKNAEKLLAKQSFDDVAATHWAAKYIYFCQSKGIINGYGDGNFGPSDKVTSTQLAKMLLCACGYGMMGEYTGSGWDVNVFVDAVTEGVYDDANTEDYGAAATRDEAALYVFNTLMKVLQVKYDVDVNKYTDIANSTFAEMIWNMSDTTVDGLDDYCIVVGNQATGKDYTVVERDGVETLFNIETGLDVIGHEVELYFENDRKSAKDEDGVSYNYYNAYLVEDVSTVVSANGYVGEIVKALGKKAGKIGAATYWVNYLDSGLVSAQATNPLSAFGAVADDFYTDANLLKNNTNTYLTNKNFIVDSLGDVIGYTTNSYSVGTVKSIVDDEITLKSDSTTYYLANAYEGIAKGDEVTIQPVGEINYIYPNSESSVYIYEKSPIFSSYNYFTLTTTPGATVSIDVGNTYDLSLDYYGAIYAAELVQGADAGYALFVATYSFDNVNAYGETVKTHFAQCVDASGKEVIYTLYTEKAGVVTPTNYDVTTVPGATCVVSVKVDADGYAKLAAVDLAKSYTNTPNFKGAGKDSVIIANYYLNASTAIYYVNGERATLDVEAASYFNKGNQKCFFYGVANGSAYNVPVVWVYDTEFKPEAADSFIYVNQTDWTFIGYGIVPFTAASGSSYINGEEVSYFTVYVDGVTAYPFIDDSSAGYSSGVVSRGFYQYTVDANNVYTLVAPSGVAVVESLVIDNTVSSLNSGMLFAAGTYRAWGVDISELTVFDLSGAVDAKGYARNIDSVEEIEDLLEDYNVTITYVADENEDGDWMPVKALYVTAVTAK